MNLFLLGAIAALTVGVFVPRFWRQTRDRLFLFFGLGFLVEGVNRTALALSGDPREGEPLRYVVRAGAFLLILFAIWDKNRSASQRGASGPPCPASPRPGAAANPGARG